MQQSRDRSLADLLGPGCRVGRTIGLATLIVLGSASPIFAAEPGTEQAPPGDERPPTEATRSRPPASTIPLLDCIRRALKQNVALRSASDDVAIAETSRDEVRGRFGPKLHLEGSFQRWNEPYIFNGFPIHDISQWNVTASLSQPVTALLAIYDAYKVRDFGVDIAAVRREAVARELALEVVSSYYRLLQAERLVEVANASVEQLSAQLKQSRSFHTNGVVSQDDVLRAELALQGAMQRAILARGKVSLERAQLAVLLALSPDSSIEAQPRVKTELPQRSTLSLDQADRLAQARRIELRELDARMQQASLETRLAYMKFVPQVNLVGAYIHNEGSPLTPINTAYVGAVANWDVWDWGTTGSGVSAAKLRAHQALLARSKIADQIRLEVRRAFVNASTTGEAINVAQASVASAEENFRLVKKRYDASAATSFDVVDAEGLLTQARGQLQTAVYDLLIANAALMSATGSSPEALANERP